MSEHKDGGPAFPGEPLTYRVHEDDRMLEAMDLQVGMSLRDWFAGQVLASTGALPLGEKDCTFRAKVAYQMADAMIKERSK